MKDHDTANAFPDLTKQANDNHPPLTLDGEEPVAMLSYLPLVGSPLIEHIDTDSLTNPYYMYARSALEHWNTKKSDDTHDVAVGPDNKDEFDSKTNSSPPSTASVEVQSSVSSQNLLRPLEDIDYSISSAGSSVDYEGLNGVPDRNNSARLSAGIPSMRIGSRSSGSAGCSPDYESDGNGENGGKKATDEMEVVTELNKLDAAVKPLTPVYEAKDTCSADEPTDDVLSSDTLVKDDEDLHTETKEDTEEEDEDSYLQFLRAKNLPVDKIRGKDLDVSKILDEEVTPRKDAFILQDNEVTSKNVRLDHPCKDTDLDKLEERMLLEEEMRNYTYKLTMRDMTLSEEDFRAANPEPVVSLKMVAESSVETRIVPSRQYTLQDNLPDLRYDPIPILGTRARSRSMDASAGGISTMSHHPSSQMRSGGAVGDPHFRHILPSSRSFASDNRKCDEEISTSFIETEVPLSGRIDPVEAQSSFGKQLSSEGTLSYMRPLKLDQSGRRDLSTSHETIPNYPGPSGFEQTAIQRELDELNLSVHDEEDEFEDSLAPAPLPSAFSRTGRYALHRADSGIPSDILTSLPPIGSIIHSTIAEESPSFQDGSLSESSRRNSLKSKSNTDGNLSDTSSSKETSTTSDPFLSCSRRECLNPDRSFSSVEKERIGIYHPQDHQQGWEQSQVGGALTQDGGVLKGLAETMSGPNYQTLPRKAARPHIGRINQYTMIEGTNYSYRADDDATSAQGPPLPPKTRKKVDRSKSLDIRNKEPTTYSKGGGLQNPDSKRQCRQATSTLCPREPLLPIQVDPDISNNKDERPEKGRHKKSSKKRRSSSRRSLKCKQSSDSCKLNDINNYKNLQRANTDSQSGDNNSSSGAVSPTTGYDCRKDPHLWPGWWKGRLSERLAATVPTQPDSPYDSPVSTPSKSRKVSGPPHYSPFSTPSFFVLLQL